MIQPVTSDGRGSRIDQPDYDRILSDVTVWVEGPGEAWAQHIEQTGSSAAAER